MFSVTISFLLLSTCRHTIYALRTDQSVMMVSVDSKVHLSSALNRSTQKIFEPNDAVVFPESLASAFSTPVLISESRSGQLWSVIKEGRERPTALRLFKDPAEGISIISRQDIRAAITDVEVKFRFETEIRNAEIMMDLAENSAEDPIQHGKYPDELMRIYDVQKDDASPMYIEMELCDGQTLRQYFSFWKDALRQHMVGHDVSTPMVPIPLPVVREVSRRLLIALHFLALKNIVYHSLNEDAIILNIDDKTVNSLKLVDFRAMVPASQQWIAKYQLTKRRVPRSGSRAWANGIYWKLAGPRLQGNGTYNWARGIGTYEHTPPAWHMGYGLEDYEKKDIDYGRTVWSWDVYGFASLFITMLTGISPNTNYAVYTELGSMVNRTADQLNDAAKGLIRWSACHATGRAIRCIKPLLSELVQRAEELGYTEYPYKGGQMLLHRRTDQSGAWQFLVDHIIWAMHPDPSKRPKPLNMLKHSWFGVKFPPQLAKAYSDTVYIKSGGFGQVWSVVKDGTPMALKLFVNPVDKFSHLSREDIGKISDAKTKFEFESEIQNAEMMIQRFDGRPIPHLMTVYGVQENSELPFYVEMEWCQGQNLFQYEIASGEAHEDDHQGPFTLHVIRQVSHKLLKALAFLVEHDLVHHDVKDLNIMVKIDDKGTVESLTLVDYGAMLWVAALRNSTSFEGENVPAGTSWASGTYYKLTGGKPHGSSNDDTAPPAWQMGYALENLEKIWTYDVYSFGIIFLEMVTGMLTNEQYQIYDPEDFRNDRKPSWLNSRCEKLLRWTGQKKGPSKKHIVPLLTELMDAAKENEYTPGYPFRSGQEILELNEEHNAWGFVINQVARAIHPDPSQRPSPKEMLQDRWLQGLD